MGSLYDSFPDALKKEFSERKLEIGSVLLIQDHIAGKEKFHIIVGFDGAKISTATVRINSEKNRNVFKGYLENLCVTIKEDNYEFLDHNSIVDCSKVVEWETQNLSKILIQKPDTFKGNLTERDLGIIRSILATARTIEPKRRKKFGLV